MTSSTIRVPWALTLALAALFLAGRVQGQPTPKPYGECKAPVGPVPALLASGTFNADTFNDVAFLDAQGAEVKLVFGDEALTKGICPVPTPQLVGFSGAGTNGVGISRLNVGRPDSISDLVVVTNVQGGGVFVFRNAGGATPTFNVDPVRPLTDARAVATADFDNNGIDDFAVGTGNNSVVVYYGTTNGSFPTAITTDVGVPVDRLIVGFVNRDGFPDLVILSGNPPESAPRIPGIRILLNSATANAFGTSLPIDPLSAGDVPQHPVAAAIGDFNDDGNADLVVVDGKDVLLRLPTFTPSQTPLATAPASPTNTRNSATNTPTPTGPTNSTPTRTPTTTSTPTPTPTITLTRTPIADGDVIVFLADPTPREGKMLSYSVGDREFAGRGASAVAVSDFNNDFLDDVVVASITDDRVSFFMGDRDGQLHLEDPCPSDACNSDDGSLLAGCCVGSGPRSIVLSSLDDSVDARPDIIVANADGASISFLVSSAPAATFTPTSTGTPTFTNTPGPTRTFTRSPQSTKRATATCPPTGICVQGDSCAIAAPHGSTAMIWPWIGAAMLLIARKRRR